MPADSAREPALLLVTLMDPDAPPGGRELLSRLNARALAAMFGDALAVHRLTRKPAPSLADALHGRLGGLDPDEIARIVARVGDMSAGQVFVDGSTLGHVVAPIKRAYPHVRVVTFFYNVEARFFLGAARAKRTALSLALLAATWAAERTAVRHSDTIICLSARESPNMTMSSGSQRSRQAYRQDEICTRPVDNDRDRWMCSEIAATDRSRRDKS